MLPIPSLSRSIPRAKESERSVLGELLPPTLLTIAFIACVGLYGFFKFSHENDMATRVNAAVNPKESTQPVSTVSTLTNQNDIDRETLVRVSIDGSIRPLITYVYIESPDARENLIFFLDNGLHNSADFIFILNGPTDAAKLIPRKANIQVVSSLNNCPDLDAHGEVLRKDGTWKNYSKFILINSEIRGPFMPYWSRSCWSDIFLSRVTKDVKLVGMSASCQPEFHIQPMLWATDSVGMELLLNTLNSYQTVTLGECYEDKKHALYAEVEAIATIKNAGFKVDTITAASRDSEKLEDDYANDLAEDVLCGKRHHSTSIDPYETIFTETSHNADPASLVRLTEWHKTHATNVSQGMCG